MRGLNRNLTVAVLWAGAAACSLTAPSDDDLYDGGPSRDPQLGGRPSNSGGVGGLAGNGQGGARAGSGGVSFAGEAGADGLGGDLGRGGALGGGGAGAAAPEGGTATEGGAGGAAGVGGSAGSGGADPVCAMECGPNQACTATAVGAECTCVEGFVRDGAACRRPRSCGELHRAAPELGSGAYTLQPVGAASSFRAYCGMALEGGGWTLVVSEGLTFDPATMGVSDSVCYSSSCTNLAYSSVLLEADVMIDVSNSPIVNATYAARVIVNGVHAMSRGKTLRTLFTTGPNYVEAEDNSNVAVRMIGGAECTTLPKDLATVVCTGCATAGCKVPVMVFGDGDSPAGCRETPVPRFAIGAANDYATAWTNCAGWPQDPNHLDFDFYPDYVRVWIR